MSIVHSVSIIFGGLLKIYDDVTDIPAYSSLFTPQMMEIIKVFLIASFTYISMNNSVFPFIIYTFHGLHGVFVDEKALQDNFYRASMLLALLLCIITFSLSNLTWSLLVVFILGAIMVTFDHKICPEEHSLIKILWRSWVFIGMIVYITFISRYIDFIDRDIVIMSASYLFMSIINMIYIELQSHKNQSKLDTRELFNDSATHRGIQQAVPNPAAISQHLSASSSKGSIGTKKS
jgi:hypothetical protein